MHNSTAFKQRYKLRGSAEVWKIVAFLDFDLVIIKYCNKLSFRVVSISRLALQDKQQEQEMQINISDIKTGDKIQLKQGDDWYVVSLIAEERVYAIPMNDFCTVCVTIDNIGKVYSTGIQETVNESQQPKQHKHKDSIIAWANGAKIQYSSKLYGCWMDCINPAWAPEQEYRIKPTKAANNIKRMYVEHKPCLDNAWNKPNLELEFDAESGELVKATILE